MNGQRIGCVVVMGLGLALAAPAAGQEPADTRSGEAAAARQAKAASPEQNDRSSEPMKSCTPSSEVSPGIASRKARSSR